MDPFEAAKRRREHLRVERNPRPGLEYIVTLEGRMDVMSKPIRSPVLPAKSTGIA